eukprot:COSAG05_NODE_17289_length_328_cov_0.681223_1_plen_37_part_10
MKVVNQAHYYDRVSTMSEQGHGQNTESCPFRNGLLLV